MTVEPPTPPRPYTPVAAPPPAVEPPPLKAQRSGLSVFGTVIRVLALLDALGDVATAARRLTVHPNTLRHRLRRNPLDEAVAGTRVERALEEAFGA